MEKHLQSSKQVDKKLSKGEINLTSVKTLEWHHLTKKMTRGSKTTNFETVSFMNNPLRLAGVLAQSKLLALIRISKFSCLTVGPLPFSCLKPTDFKGDIQWLRGMEDGGVDRTVIDCRQDQLGQLNGRLFSSFNFFSFWLIKTWCTSNWISDHSAHTDEVS